MSILREKFTPSYLNTTILEFVNTWKNSGNQSNESGAYGSRYNGKDFTDPKEVAWVNFPWQDLTGTEKGFIKSTWERYSSGEVWPASQISDSSKQKDTGKFLFFDLFNLAPTLLEYNGYNSSPIYNWPDFYRHNLSTYLQTGRPVLLYSLNATQNNKSNFAGDSAQLFSEKFNRLSKSEYYRLIINDEKFGQSDARDYPDTSDIYKKIQYPFEDEFKLSWMRDFVQIGLENRMGPFAADLKEDGTVNKHDDGTAFIRIGNISKLIEHRDDYKKAIFYQWAQSELDWANGKDQNFNKNYNYETDKSPKPPKEYLEAILTPYNDKYDGGQIGPELDGEYRLKSDYFLKDGSPAFLNLSGFNISTRKNNTSDISQGHLPFIYSGKNIDELNTPNYKMYYEDLFYVIGAHAGIIEGGFQENVQPSSDETKQMFIHLTNFTNREFSGLLKQKDSSGTGLDQEPDKVLIERKNIQSDKSLVSPSLSFSKYENIAIGIPPYYKTDEDRRNNIVSGWIVLPHLFGRLQLPWSFVWKYIGVSGFIKIENTPPEQRPNMYYNDGNPDDAIFNADNVSQTPYGPDKKPSQNWLKQNARTRFWHFRYGIRTDNKKILDGVGDFDNYWKGSGATIVGSIDRMTYIFNRYNWNDTVTKKSLDWSTSEPELPLRELFFYLRMKYGISRAAGLRYVIREGINDTYAQISTIHGGGIPNDKIVIDKILEKTNRSGRGIDLLNCWNDQPNVKKPTHLLRSKYISILHDRVGWARYKTDQNPNEDYGNHQLPTPETIHTFSTDPNFATSEITDYKTTGFYSFCGGLTDRFPWILRVGISRNYPSWLEHKRDTRISVDPNHLSFAYLLNNLETQTEGPRAEDGLDRYTSPNLPLTYGKKFNVKKGKKQSYSSKEEFVDTEKFDHVWYYDHSVNQEYSPRDEFNPVLLSKKELQFIYEMVTYNLYGTEPKTTGIWDYTFSDRWAELNYRINIPLYDVSEKWYTRNMYGSEAIFNDSSYFAVDVNPNHIVTLSDYILWAAPTEDQFYKKQFSKTNNTFIQKYINQKSDKKDWVWQNNEPLSFLESKFPFSALSEYIIKSENSSRPIVPAFVHHRYISRLLNQEQKYNDVGIDNRSIKNDIIGSVVRTMGGKRLNQDSQDEGVLITLPSFVLGGRIDLGESIDDWDPTWGKVCPFSMQEYTYPDGTKKQMLIVGNLDDVIDSWAKGKTYKNPKDKNAKPKYVSAMEISFWIRYRQGLASAPTNRRVDNPIDTTNIVYNRTELKKESRWPWPISNIYINAPAIYRDEVNGGTLDIIPREETISSEFNLSFETLNGISMLTSYYNPIIVNNEQKPGLCIDPLIEIPTAKEGNQTNAYTGFNSRYACNWPGAPQVAGIRDLTSEAIFGATVTDFLLNNTVLSNKFSRDYLTVHKLYRTVQRGPNGKKSDGSSLTGFDYHKNDEECNKVILASDIQAWFKAYKVIEEINKFSDYISKGKELPPGTKNSVLEVEGRIGKRNDETETRDSFTAEDFTHFYISGESQGSTQTNWNNPTVLSYEEQMRIRPWNDRIEFGFASKQYDAVTAFASDYSLGSTGCIPNKRYMRHILTPNTFMYLSQRTEVGEQGGSSSTPVYGAWYTYEQVDNIKKAIYDTLMVWNVPPDNDLNNTLSPGAKQYATLLKSNKWVKTLSKSGYDPNNKKDLRKFNSFDQFVTEYNATEKKNVWNSFALKLTTSILTSIASVKYLDIEKVTKLSPILKDTKNISLTVYGRANKALRTNYGHWFDNANAYSKINSFTKDKVLLGLRVLLDAYDAGWFGARPKGLPDAIDPEENLLFGIYKKGKPVVSFIEGRLEATLAKFLIEKATASILETSALGEVAGKPIAEIVAGELAGDVVLGVAIRLSATSFIIGLAVAVVFYAIARIREDWEKDQQIQEMWKFLREAERYGYLEGPYLQSEGSIKIKKTVNNEIKVLGKKYIPSYEKNYALDKDEDPSESSKYKEGKPSVSVQEPVNLEKMTSAELYKFVKTANDKFYETGGVFENILKDIRKDSCECDFLYSIVAYNEEPDMQVKDIRNREITEWASGSFKRRLFERENVLDEAPIFSDNPFVFIAAPEPEYDTPWWPDNNSVQEGDAQRQHSDQRLRSWGSSGIVVYEGDAYSGTRSQKYRCSRFWWPSLVVNQNTDLCQFMARDGKYPKRRAQWLYGCELNEGEPNQRISLTPEQDRLLDIEYQKPGRFFVRAAYSRVDNKSKNIPYVKFTGTSNVKNLSLRGSLLYTNSNNITEEKVEQRASIDGKINKGELFNYKYTRRTHPKSSTYGYGESLITAEGVNGPAPPHEREIVNIFRRKYKIDLVIPGHWTAGDKNYFNPKKDKSIGESTTFKPGGCCGMTEIVDPGEDVTFPEGGNEDPKSEDIGNNLKKKQQASYCEYVISLNTPEFKNAIKKKCKKEKKEEQKQEEKTEKKTDPTPIPKPKTATSKTPQIFIPTGGNMDAGVVSRTGRLDGVVMPGIRITWPNTRTATVEIKNQPEQEIKPTFQDTYKNANKDTVFGKVKVTTTNNTGKKDSTPGNNQPSTDDVRKRKTKKRTKTPLSTPLTPGQTVPTGGSMNSSTITNTTPDPPNDEIKTGRGVPDKGQPGNEACFPSWVNVMTKTSQKNIDEIQIGETIISYDLSFKSFVESEVEDIIVHENKIPVYTFTFSDGTNIDSTENHYVLNSDGIFVQIGFVNETEQILNNTGNYMTIVDKKLVGEEITYNLKVKNSLPYVINGVIVQSS